MIRNIHISNYALIAALDMEPAPGFNIITGETGAGKSIILGALGLLLGERADLRAMRMPEQRCVVEAEFDAGEGSAVDAILREHDLVGDVAGTVILRRELLPGGRSRAFVNDTPVTLPVLRGIAVHLVDIHSQHQNLLLSDPAYQLEIIDTLAGNADIRSEYATAFAAYRSALKKYTATREMIRRNKDDEEFIAYQFGQLEQMNLVPGETEALETEREMLVNATEINERLTAVTGPLADDDHDALGALAKAVAALESLASEYGDGATDWHSLAERLESARLEVADIAGTVADKAERLDADPARLDEIEKRLSQLYSLQNKHHVDNADGLIALYDKLGTQLAALADADTILTGLETEARRAKKAAVAVAVRLSESRAAAAAAFASELRAKASPLGMPNLRCDITLTRTRLSPTGADQIQFLFAFNKNQTLTPVGSTASGGEVSRLMLTVKSILASRMSLPTIIFDEVDTGVSGDIATRMADMMADISRNIQVMTITHLPGVAAMGERHFKVYKEDDETSTSTHVSLLDREGRRSEIAVMLGGEADEASLAAADALIAKATCRLNELTDNGKQ